MFKLNKCAKCNKEYDEQETYCPNCKEPNPSMKHGFWETKVISLRPWKQILFFMVGWLGFQLIGLLLSDLFRTIAYLNYPYDFSRNEFLTSVHVSACINFIAYLILILTFVLISWKDARKILNSFRKWIVPVAAVIGFIAIMVFNLTYNSILQVCGVKISDNANENSLNEIIRSYPILSLLVFGLIGPLCEELTYRLGLYSFLRRINVILAFAITMVVFALIHFDFTAIGTDKIGNELLNLPFYFSAAFIFTFIYEKCGFAAAFSCHAMNNLFSILGTIVSVLIPR